MDNDFCLFTNYKINSELFNDHVENIDQLMAQIGKQNNSEQMYRVYEAKEELNFNHGEQSGNY